MTVGEKSSVGAMKMSVADAKMNSAGARMNVARRSNAEGTKNSADADEG